MCHKVWLKQFNGKMYKKTYTGKSHFLTLAYKCQQRQFLHTLVPVMPVYEFVSCISEIFSNRLANSVSDKIFVNPTSSTTPCRPCPFPGCPISEPSEPIFSLKKACVGQTPRGSGTASCVTVGKGGRRPPLETTVHRPDPPRLPHCDPQQKSKSRSQTLLTMNPPGALSCFD